MVGRLIGRRAALLGLPLAAGAGRGAAWAEAAAGTDDRGLGGQLLVASPGIIDPRFAKSVILMARHGAGGAFGIIINQPIEERSLASLLEAIGEDATGVEGTIRVFFGGPVQPGDGFVLHTADYSIAETIAIDPALSLTSSPEILVDLGHARGPLKSLLAFGYAGWGEGQLEAEIAAGGWFMAQPDVPLVFDADRDSLWDEAMRRRTVPL
jgi:putative transcriptional regulator